MFKEIKHWLIGAPIATKHADHEKLNVPLGLAVFSADALSSTAYATDEILIALAGSAYAAQMGAISLPVAMVIIGLIALVVLSYRQIIRTYPDGGGAYVVSKENLGLMPSHLAAAALLIDYILTVSVSISAGVAALTSTGLLPHSLTTIVCVAFTITIMIVNLRGVKESGQVIAYPAYTFLASMGILILTGFCQVFLFHQGASAASPAVASNTTLNWGDMALLFVFLKAFSHGCAGLTGIEAVSNGVSAFQAPETVRANKTMVWMGCLLAGIFLGITILAIQFNIHPQHEETVLSQVASAVFGGKNFFYYLVQFSTMIMLILAANTSFAGFPRISNLLADDGYLPRQLMNMGDRLVLNNGIFILGALSIFLIWLYQGDTHQLIPLYAVGVFISFTLSQTGMVVHHRRKKEPGWRWGIVINGVGAIVTLGVTILLAIEKFEEGAWIVLIAIPALIVLFRKIKAHYLSVGKQLAMDENYACPLPLEHKVLVLVSSLGKGTIPALQYATTLSTHVEAVHVSLNKESTNRLRNNWDKYGCGIPLKILPSPYRSITEPVLTYIDQLDKENQNRWITIIVPEFVTKRLWHNLLHNQTAILLKAFFRSRKGKVVTTVRFHLDE